MRKIIRPEKVAGIVALSYLVLIPTAGIYIWRRLEKMDTDLTTVWNLVTQDDQGPKRREG